MKSGPPLGKRVEELSEKDVLEAQCGFVFSVNVERGTRIDQERADQLQEFRAFLAGVMSLHLQTSEEEGKETTAEDVEVIYDFAKRQRGFEKLAKVDFELEAEINRLGNHMQEVSFMMEIMKAAREGIEEVDSSFVTQITEAKLAERPESDESKAIVLETTVENHRNTMLILANPKTFLRYLVGNMFEMWSDFGIQVEGIFEPGVQEYKFLDYLEEHFTCLDRIIGIHLAPIRKEMLEAGHADASLIQDKRSLLDFVMHHMEEFIPTQ
jgi:hypothetical protein